MSATCLAIEFVSFGPDAVVDPDNVGVGCELEIRCHEGAISIDLIGGVHEDRRVCVNSEVLRFALAGAGVEWARRMA